MSDAVPRDGDAYWVKFTGDYRRYPHDSTEARISFDLAGRLAQVKGAQVLVETNSYDQRIVTVCLPRLDHFPRPSEFGPEVGVAHG